MQCYEVLVKNSILDKNIFIYHFYTLEDARDFAKSEMFNGFYAIIEVCRYV